MTKAEFELIETLWNVNLDDVNEVISKEEELIETLWNVNYVGLVAAVCMIGINRNIVECK